MQASIKYAADPLTKKVVHILNAELGPGHMYICGCCGNWLIPVRGPEREWHYRHQVESQCDGGLMTMIHRIAQEVLLESHQVIAPGRIGYLSYTAAVKEVRVGPYLADIGMDIEGEPAYVEIFVRSACTKEKVRHYRAGKLKSFQIDLSGVDPEIGLAELKRLVLDEPRNRKILYWPEDLPALYRPTVTAWTKEQTAWVIAGLVLLVLVLCWLFREPKRSKRRRWAY
jgi:hypothetical protein